MLVKFIPAFWRIVIVWKKAKQRRV